MILSGHGFIEDIGGEKESKKREDKNVLLSNPIVEFSWNLWLGVLMIFLLKSIKYVVIYVILVSPMLEALTFVTLLSRIEIKAKIPTELVILSLVLVSLILKAPISVFSSFKVRIKLDDRGAKVKIKNSA